MIFSSILDSVLPILSGIELFLSVSSKFILSLDEEI